MGQDRDAILARRRFFIASAIAGIVAGGCDKSSPHACLKVAPTPVADGSDTTNADAGENAPPMPCLEIAEPPKPEDGGDKILAAEPDATSDARAVPLRPCLSVPVRRDAGTPRACLKVAPDESF